MLFTRRTFVATLGMTAMAGCGTLRGDDPSYQLVAGVERKLIRGIRDSTLTKVAENTRLIHRWSTLHR